LGKQLDLFSIQELAGPGLIFWHPKGGLMRKLMEDWMREEYLKRGYRWWSLRMSPRRSYGKSAAHDVTTPRNMFTVMELDDAEYRHEAHELVRSISDLQGQPAFLSRSSCTARRDGLRCTPTSAPA